MTEPQKYTTPKNLTFVAKYFTKVFIKDQIVFKTSPNVKTTNFQ